MARAARLLSLIEVLRRHRRPVAGQALADELGVSLRTLYRDIAMLQAQGADIAGEAGVGYVLRPGFLLPPLMFTDEEIEALVLGSRFVAGRGDAELATAARQALAKISAVLPSDLREFADASGLLVPPTPQADGAHRHMPALRAAIRAQHKVRIAYQDAAGGETERIVWPFALGFFERTRVAAAWCELRQDFRAFRSDRIARLADTGQSYPRGRRVLLREWRIAMKASAADRS